MLDNAGSRKASIVIVDYGMGNVRSVQCAISRLGYDATISSDATQIIECDGLILPGVGAFGKAMENLTQRNLIEPLNERVLIQKRPIFGICLGMQLFAESSTELGTHKGLGWLPGAVKLIDVSQTSLSLPHVGWNNIGDQNGEDFYARIDSNSHFYFDHSYHFETEKEFVSSTTEYGSSLVAGVRKASIWGTQFHPEKSQTSGLKLLRNYLNFVESESTC